jgi:hypothetical protein
LLWDLATELFVVGFGGGLVVGLNCSQKECAALNQLRQFSVACRHSIVIHTAAAVVALTCYFQRGSFTSTVATGSLIWNNQETLALNHLIIATEQKCGTFFEILTPLPPVGQGWTRQAASTES